MRNRIKDQVVLAYNPSRVSAWVWGYQKRPLFPSLENLIVVRVHRKIQRSVPKFT